MAVYAGPEVVTNGLVLALDAGNRQSYPGSGTAWTDLSGNGNNGTLTNGPTYNSANKGAIVFDGTDDFVNCGQGLAFSGSWTISSWCIPTALFSGKVILSRSGDASLGYPQNYVINLFVNKFRVQTSANSYRFAESTTTAVAGSVYFVTGVYNAVTQILSIYVNGVFESSAIALTEAPPTTGVQYVQIGASDSIISPANRFIGSIAYVSIYNRALSAAEIRQNFNATRGRFGI